MNLSNGGRTRALVIRCQRHPTYTGLSERHEDCPHCQIVRRMRGATIPAYDREKGIVWKVRWGAE